MSAEEKFKNRTLCRSSSACLLSNKKITTFVSSHYEEKTCPRERHISEKLISRKTKNKIFDVVSVFIRNKAAYQSDISALILKLY